MRFLQLPNEILQRIVLDVDRPTVARLCFTSKVGYLRFLPLLYQHIELGSRNHIKHLQEGFIDNPYLKETVRQRTQTVTLKCRQGGTQTLHWRITVSLLEQLSNVTKMVFRDFVALSTHNVQQVLVALPRLSYVSFEYCHLIPSSPLSVSELLQEAFVNSSNPTTLMLNGTVSSAFNNLSTSTTSNHANTINHAEESIAALGVIGTTTSFSSPSDHRYYCTKYSSPLANVSLHHDVLSPTDADQIHSHLHNGYCYCWCTRASLPNIETLLLNWTDFSTEAIQQLLEAMPNITRVFLGANHNRKPSANNSAIQSLICYCSKVQHISVYLQQIEEATVCEMIRVYGKQLLSLAIRCDGEATLKAISTYCHRLQHLSIRCNQNPAGNLDSRRRGRSQWIENPSSLIDEDGQTAAAAVGNGITVDMILQSCEALEYLEMIGWSTQEVPTIVLERVQHSQHVVDRSNAVNSSRRLQTQERQESLLLQNDVGGVGKLNSNIKNNNNKIIKLNALDLSEIRQRFLEL